jgi:hypothetical protein
MFEDLLKFSLTFLSLQLHLCHNAIAFFSNSYKHNYLFSVKNLTCSCFYICVFFGSPTVAITFITKMYDALCYVMLPLQVLLGSTSKIDKAYTYRFLWPWLGSGLLTSTGKVIEKYSCAVSKMIEPHSSTVSRVIVTHAVTVSKVIEQHSSTVSKVIVAHSGTVSKVIEPHSVAVIMVIEVHSATVNKVIEPHCASVRKENETHSVTASNNSPIISLFITIVSFLL